MVRSLGPGLLALLALAGCASPERHPALEAPADEDTHGTDAALAELQTLLDGAPNAGPLHGEDDWLFLRPEAHLLLAGRFWGADSRGISLVTDPEARDPLPQILSFRDQLAARGIALLFVPIPAKLAVYPEKVLGSARGRGPLRLDRGVAEFLQILGSEGVDVLDLTPVFLARKQVASEDLFLATDSHWTPHGLHLAAETIAGALRQRAPSLGLELPEGAPEPLGAAEIQWAGDIAGPLKHLGLGPETVALLPVAQAAEGSGVVAEQASPLLLLGDSYLKIFAEQASDFRLHLQRSLGIPVDQIAVEAGGPTASRQALARDPGRLSGKRIVVWLAAARTFVSGMGWRPVDLPPRAEER